MVRARKLLERFRKSSKKEAPPEAAPTHPAQAYVLDLDKAKRVIGTLNLYGKIYYEWTLATDIIRWRGPIGLLIPTKDGTTITGDIFLSHLSLADFNRRLAILDKAVATEEKTFSATFHLKISGDTYCRVEEYGNIVLSEDGSPEKILGVIEAKPPAQDFKAEGSPSPDPLTKHITSPDLEKKLDQCIAKSIKDKVFGAYVTVTIDQLMHITLACGVKTSNKVISMVAERLQETIRDDDILGRVNGNSFGIILNQCDRWGIISTSERIIDSIQKARIKTKQHALSISVSTGGVIFPCDEMSAHSIMAESILALTDTQQSKGVARYWAPSLLKGGSKHPPQTTPNKPTGKRRQKD